MAIGVGLGGEAASFGALLHMTYHSLAKPVAFFSAGTLAQLHRSSDFDDDRRRDVQPHAGRERAASCSPPLMITGSPPFGLFFSEMTILRAGFAGRAPGGVAVLPRGAGRAVLRVRLPGGPRSCSASPARGRRTVPDPERFDLGDGHDGAGRRRGGRLGVLSAGAAAGADPRRAPGRGGRMNPATGTGIQATVSGGVRSRRRARSASRARASCVLEVELGGAARDSADRDRGALRARGSCRCSPATSATRGGGFVLHHVWSLPRQQTFLRIVGAGEPGAAALPFDRRAHPAANWFEREVMDFFGLAPEGHPNPTRVALHDDWPEGAWALRKDFPDDRRLPRGRGQPPSVPAGDRRGRVPGARRPGARGHHRAGPLPVRRRGRAGAVPAAPAVLRAQGHREALRAAALAARPLPGRVDLRRHGRWPRARLRPRDRAARRRGGAAARAALRVVLLELERLYNHIADIGAIATDVAFTVPASRAQALREGLVCACRNGCFGTRLLRGTVALGGVKARSLRGRARRGRSRHLRRAARPTSNARHPAHRRGHASPTASTAPAC